MKFEQQLKIEKEKRNREYLLELQKSGKYVFHGSPEDIDILEPRQAYDQNKETGEIETNMTQAEYSSLKKNYREVIEKLGMLPAEFKDIQQYLWADQKYIKEQEEKRVARLQEKCDIFDSIE